ncbi:MAG TPA: cytochrome c oxidase assembly protein [Thermomicrobiales bacterium]|nr:cytochrome c oxidase assembly protein [Thermomicrobiales bacterium]
MASPLPFIPPMHVGGPEPTGPLYTHWFLDPKVAVAIFGLTALYLAWVGPLNRRRPGAELRPVTTAQIVKFLFGSLTALVALGPPIDDWSHFFFSSAHMLQHLILILLSTPLWIAGVPAWVYRPLVANPVTNWFFSHLTRPIPAFLLASMINVVWHMPVAYELALSSEFWHSVQHGCFIIAGVLMWWPIMSPVPEWPKLAQPMQALYIFAQAIPTGIIGAFLTYAGPLYPHYEEASVRPWGIDLKTDQELAGLQMWVGMNTVFLIIVTIIFLRWATREEQRDNDALRRKSQRLAIQPPSVNGMDAKQEPQPRA